MAKRLRWIVPLVVLCLGIAAHAEAAVPAARVLETKGKVVVKPKGDDSRELAPLDTVYLDEKVVLVSGSSAVLAFRADGHIERLSQPGEVVVTKTGCDPKTGVEVLEAPERHKKLVSATVMSLHPRGSAGVTIFRSAGPGKPPPMRISPVRGSTILTERPRLAWSAVPDAVRYEVAVKVDPKGWGMTTKETQADYPGDPPLKPGSLHEWLVTVTLADGTTRHACEGEFTVATEEQRARAADLKPLATGTDVAYLALAAVWYDENNMIPEAVAAYERLVSLEPGVAVFHFALSRLYMREERPADSQKAYARGRQLKPLPAKPPRPSWLPKG
ncbi:MAG: hypothetical protein ABR915_10225 [Thermoguttaceae bacterium]